MKLCSFETGFFHFNVFKAHVVAGVRAEFLFIAKTFAYSKFLLFSKWWKLGYFHFLITVLCTLVLSFLWHVWVAVEWLYHTVNSSLTFLVTARLFSKVLHHFTFPAYSGCFYSLSEIPYMHATHVCLKEIETKLWNILNYHSTEV